MGVSPRTAWKWLARYQAEGESGLLDRSSRPHRPPGARRGVGVSPRRDRRLHPTHLRGAPAKRAAGECDGVLARAAAWFQGQGILRLERVMTDNGAAYVSHQFRAAVAALGARHLRTRPYTPRTNGKVERVIQQAALGVSEQPPHQQHLSATTGGDGRSGYDERRLFNPRHRWSRISANRLLERRRLVGFVGVPEVRRHPGHRLLLHAAALIMSSRRA